MNISEYQNYHETKSHTDSRFPYNTYLCSIPLDFTHVPLHWHSELELIVIKRGRGIVSVDLNRHYVCAGDVVLIRPGQLHSIEQEKHYCVEYENIILKPELLISGPDDLCAIRFIQPLLDGRIPAQTHFTSATPYFSEISQNIRQIDLLCDARPEGYQLAVKGYLFQLFFVLISNQKKKGEDSPSQKKTLEKMKTILKYVEENYSQHVTIDDMAKLTYYSKSHFMKFFKGHMGISFIEYLNDYRLTMAERMLRFSDASILGIAESCGFENLSYFNRIFKRKYGQSPGKWRSLYGE
ncbi:AraC-like DNA-binding protein/mannose-6-phosphate isomerase-like protein (cupin superfamily) [Catenibacillus scindens]|uniref:AraC-like DNA-binding protein/mannose-6-phosphate isomerase-like protein (Cupin superfamily) n=1 Tax=Catenibacillus scindens TaxID=673271 RepID=A0A7W8HD10_9FIRM|nr:AraC family transcriptional regulator [Catenibacillus scindens]MBB5266113.1 AraC-like DNA-binding protein/mannose-6-phosphate isomerase-like protein (cupin superfamily) [Catenibacillus scindens]